MKTMEAEVVIVGSGPGGATLARELAGRGLRVLLIEKGSWPGATLGRYLSVGTITRIVLPRGRPGIMARGVCVGGTTMVFNGNAYDPPAWLKDELGIDLAPDVAAVRTELGIKPLPDDFFAHWPATGRLVEAAGKLGIILKPQDKYIDPDRCDPYCDDCNLGCRRGAKWTAREYVLEALDRGAGLLDRTTVSSIIIERGRAVGVLAQGPRGPILVRGEKVVLAAGGMGTPVILMKSGVCGAGRGFFIDPMNVVWALSRHPVGRGEQTFSVAAEQYMAEDEFMIGNLGRLYLDPTSVLGWLRGYGFGHVMGMFAKMGDSAGGRINPRGRVHKPYSAQDLARFQKGTEICKRIMLEAGANPGTFLVLPNVGGHPGGTAAIGTVVDANLESLEIQDLYVCDASVFPRSPGRPPSLTIIALARRLARYIEAESAQAPASPQKQASNVIG
ncbi:MAG: GMC family oxidoreductase [Thermodesulfobacteriota bacterium]